MIFDYIMEKINDYLKFQTEINKNKLLNNYKKYGYDDYDEMFLDLNLLLNTKYPNIRLICNQLTRDGQSKFRQEIVKRDIKCIISGTGELSCEAAHIIPYNNCDNDKKYDINNGLLLESGIHKLFDKYLWSINGNKVIISNKILNNDQYANINLYNKKELQLNKKQKMFLKKHFKNFKNKNKIC